MTRKAAALFRGQQILVGNEVEEFWALRDVSFEIKRGEVLGVIGRNGAGKSTLLKILSRITEPTAGRVKIRGRVASLLEVGTGFHPELTGRENIYLNGAILGMSKREIRGNFDEIVAFAEVEKFIDTPVKRYSSGMYVRLAFAVAAHLEPEILVIDEVLAVGDAEFQKRCLGKMQEVSQTGRTVLFVSHNLLSIRRLCTRALLLNKGRTSLIASTPQVLENYTSMHLSAAKTSTPMSFEANQIKLEVNSVSPSDTSIDLQLRIKISHSVPRFGIHLQISDSVGTPVLNLPAYKTGLIFSRQSNGNLLQIRFDNILLQLNGGSYYITVIVTEPKSRQLACFENIHQIEVPPHDLFQSGHALTSEDGYPALQVKCSELGTKETQ